MKTNRTFLNIVLIAVILVALGVTLFRVAKITGFSTDYGYVNVTIAQNLDINFSRSAIIWGSGTVNTGTTAACLYTTGETSVVGGGSWTADEKAIILENIGNIDANLTLDATLNASDLFGPLSTSPGYQWNISNKDPNSCTLNDSAELIMDLWQDVNTSGQYVCNFSYLSASNEIYIDINMSIPYDSNNSNAGEIFDTITAAVTAMA